MLIDFHTHIFPEKIAKKTIEFLSNQAKIPPYTDGTAQGLVSNMEKANCDIAVALPVVTKPSQFESINAFAYSINETYKNSDRKIISFGGIHPKCDDKKAKMHYLKELGFKGIKIHPDYQETYIDDEGYIEILNIAKELDMIVVTHAGVDDGYPNSPVRCTPERLLKVIKEVKHDKFVLAHFGAHSQWEEVSNLLCGENVYFDTGFTLHQIEKNLFLNILNKHSEDKILFATDCPWQDIKTTFNIIKSYGLKDNTLDKITFKNAKKLLGIL